MTMLKRLIRPLSVLTSPPAQKVVALKVTILLLCGCSQGIARGGGGLGLGPESRYVIHTPQTYTENRVFSLSLDDPPSGQLSLHHPHEATVSPDRAVKHNQPLSVIVNGVYLPPTAALRDVAVIVDIASLTDGSVTSLVVWYQRRVPGNQMLNFQDLLVYFDPAWNSTVGPHFRLRLIDVKQTQREATRRFLDQSADLAATLGGLLPHPAMPGVALAIEAARIVLANPSNEVLLDYTVQLYSQQHRELAGDAPLGVLQRGPWLVVGRPAGESPAFWTTPLRLDLRTRQLIDEAETPVEAPYIAMTISTAESVVPSIVVERSAALLALLSRSGGKRDLEEIEAQGRSVFSALATYIAHERLLRYRTVDELKAVMTLLRNRELNTLTTRDVRLLMNAVSRVAGRPFATVDDALAWWEYPGQQGIIDADRFRWLPAQDPSAEAIP